MSDKIIVSSRLKFTLITYACISSSIILTFIILGIYFDSNSLGFYGFPLGFLVIIFSIFDFYRRAKKIKCPCCDSEKMLIKWSSETTTTRLIFYCTKCEKKIPTDLVFTGGC